MRKINRKPLTNKSIRHMYTWRKRTKSYQLVERVQRKGALKKHL